MKIGVIIMNRDRPELTDSVYEQILPMAPNANKEVVVIEAGSNKETGCSQYMTHWFSDPKYRGRYFAFNKGLEALRNEHGDFDFYWFIANDITFPPQEDALSELIACMKEDPQMGLIGPSESNQEWYPGAAAQDNTRWHKSATVHGLAQLIRGEIVHDIGYMNPAFHYSQGAGTEYAYKLYKAGWFLAYADRCSLSHAESSTYGVVIPISRHEYQRRANLFAAKYLSKHYGNDWDSLFSSVLPPEINGEAYQWQKQVWSKPLARNWKEVAPPLWKWASKFKQAFIKLSPTILLSFLLLFLFLRKPLATQEKANTEQDSQSTFNTAQRGAPLNANEGIVFERLSKKKLGEWEDPTERLRQESDELLNNLATAQSTEAQFSHLLNVKGLSKKRFAKNWKNYHSKVDFSKTLPPAYVPVEDLARGVFYRVLRRNNLPKLKQKEANWNVIDKLVGSSLSEKIQDINPGNGAGAIFFFVKDNNNKLKLDWATYEETASNKFHRLLRSPKENVTTNLLVKLKRTAHRGKPGYGSILINAFDAKAIDGIRFVYEKGTDFSLALHNTVDWLKPQSNAYFVFQWKEKNGLLELHITDLVSWEPLDLGIASGKLPENIAIDSCYTSSEIFSEDEI